MTEKFLRKTKPKTSFHRSGIIYFYTKLYIIWLKSQTYGQAMSIFTTNDFCAFEESFHERAVILLEYIFVITI